MPEIPSPHTEQDTTVSGRARRRLNAQETRERRRRAITWAFSIALGVLLINALVGEGGYLATLRAHRDEAALQSAVARIRTENRRLQEERDRLEHDPAALEEAARERLGLIRPGETLVIIKDAPGIPPGSPAR